MVNALFYLALCVGSAICYRLGGSKKGLTKWRDLGCSLMAILALWHLLGFHWVYCGIFLLQFAALTTYWNTIFGYDNMYAHGFGIGLSTFPLIFIGVHWYLVVIYVVILSALIGATRHVLKIDNKLQELIKGFLIIILLLIYRR